MHDLSFSKWHIRPTSDFKPFSSSEWRGMSLPGSWGIGITAEVCAHQLKLWVTLVTDVTIRKLEHSSRTTLQCFKHNSCWRILRYISDRIYTVWMSQIGMSSTAKRWVLTWSLHQQTTSYVYWYFSYHRLILKYTVKVATNKGTVYNSAILCPFLERKIIMRLKIQGSKIIVLTFSFLIWAW